MLKFLSCSTLLFISTGFAETFINTLGSTNTLTIATNEAVLVNPVTLQNDALLVKGGTTNSISFGAINYDFVAPIAIAGPVQLRFTTRTVLSFSRIQGTNIQTLLIPPTEERYLIISTNKALRFFRPIGIAPFDTFLMKDGDSARIRIVAGLELTGDFTLRLVNGAGDVSIVSFYSTEDFLKVPELGFLRGPTGSFEISVEKSVDLTGAFLNQ